MLAIEEDCRNALNALYVGGLSAFAKVGVPVRKCAVCQAPYAVHHQCPFSKQICAGTELYI